MEDKLGFKIFDRSSQGVTLTPEGEQIARDIQTIYEISEHWNAIREVRNQVDGVVRLVASTSICNTIIPAIMLECREKYPRLQIQQYEARDDAMLTLMAKKRMIGVAGAVPLQEAERHYAQFAKENNYYLEYLRKDQYYIYINAKNPLAGKDQLTLSDLSQLIPALYPMEDKRFFFRTLFDHFSAEHPVCMMHQENIFQLVAENSAAACIFPGIAGRGNYFVENGLVVKRTVRDLPMEAVACMLHPVPKELTSGEKTVMDLLRKNLSDEA